MTPELKAELEKAVAIVERHRRASVTLRIFSDPSGRARVRVERLDGVSLTELLDGRATLGASTTT